jgi:Protein of unknown function (DUF3300)/Chaperone of endosialidase
MTTIALRLFTIAFLLSVPPAAMAQSPPQPATAPAQADQLLKPEQLDALVAPIALYPDTLLAEILMASTYPLEVVEADRWAEANKSLKGDALKAAVDKQSWDDSVKSLVATPSVLEMMSTKLDWTQALGNAVLAQQPDVMDAVQRLRAKAQANNKLISTPQQTVSTQQQDGQQAIVIAPTDPDTIFVPYYDPSVVYGPWSYPAYPPYYWPAPGYIAGGIIATGIAFGAGYALRRWVSGGYRWGGGVNWGNRNININRSVNINNINVRNNNWTHNPVHRQGVRYTNANVAQKFGGNRNVGGGSQTRMDFRGRSGRQVLQPGAGAGGNRPNLGGGAGAKPGAGNLKAGNVAGGNNRPAGGNRPAAGTRPAGNALGNAGSANRARVDSNRGRQSLANAGGANRGGAGARAGGGGGGARAAAGGGGARAGGGGGGARAAAGGGGRGGGGGGGRGGGRRSDIRLKHDIALLGRLDNSLGFYRFAYNGGDKLYVGVMAQEVQAVMPGAVVRGRDGYLRVFYDKIGLPFQTYNEWQASGARVPVAAAAAH